MITIFLLDLAAYLFYILFLGEVQLFPYVSWFPPVVLLVHFFYSIYVWMLDPGLATLVPEYLPEPLTTKQALRRFCRTCKIVRGPGVNHCTFCEVCIQDYDHHCGIVGKCSGANSHTAISVWAGIIGVYWGTMLICAIGIGYSLIAQYLANRYLAKK